MANVRFGTAQEKREAAQEGGVQTASFECERSSTLDGVTLKDRIGFDGSQWDIIERAPLERRDIRFTGVRSVGPWASFQSVGVAGETDQALVP